MNKKNNLANKTFTNVLVVWVKGWGWVKGGVNHHTWVYMMDSYSVAAVIRGYHIYRKIWNVAIGQILLFQQEPGNSHDPYSFSVLQQ